MQQILGGFTVRFSTSISRNLTGGFRADLQGGPWRAVRHTSRLLRPQTLTPMSCIALEFDESEPTCFHSSPGLGTLMAKLCPRCFEGLEISFNKFNHHSFPKFLP
jgi:hypothetical protein